MAQRARPIQAVPRFARRLRLAPFSLLACAGALALAAPPAASGAASEWSSNPHAKVRLLTSWEIAPRKGPLRLGLHFQLSPGWHVYWKNAGDAGYPPALTLGPKGVVGEPQILWPAPDRFELPGGLVAYAYEKEVVYPVMAPVEAAAPGDSIPLAADVDYLVCAESCVPYRAQLTVDQPLGDEGIPDPAAEVLIESWWKRLPRAIGEVPGLQANAAVDGSRPGAPSLEVRILGPTTVPGEGDIFLESQDRFEVGPAAVRPVPGGVIFRIPLKPRVAGAPLPASLPFAWTATGLSQGGETFSLEARGDVPVNAAAMPAEGAAAGSPAGAGAPAALTRSTLPAVAFRAFLAGLTQLATPAPLALLLALLLALRPPAAGEEGGGPSGRERFAAAATGVVAGSWIVAALGSWALRSGVALPAGPLVEGDPLWAALLAALALLLALNLWGLTSLPLPTPAPGGKPGPGATARLLLAGLLAAPLALAWPLPLLRQTAEAGRAHGPAAFAALFAVAGFGLAAPLLLGVLAPAYLGRRGAGSEREGTARTVLGFLAAAGALRLLFVLSRQIRPEGLAALELALLGAALAAWLHHRARGEGPERGQRLPLRILLACGLVAALAAAPWIAERFRFVPRAPREGVRAFDAQPSTDPGGPVR